MADKKPRKNEPIDAAEDEGNSVEIPTKEEQAGAVEEQAVSPETLSADGEVAVNVDADLDGSDTRRSFLPIAPARFAVHAAFYYAGKTADKVVSVYNKVFKIDQEYLADFNKSTGTAYVRHGHWEKAIPLLEKALEANPDDLDTRMRLAEAFGGTNDYEKACEHLEMILEHDPDSTRVVRALGIAYSRRENYARAIEYLERAVKLDPNHAKAFYRLGAAYDNTKLYNQAVEAFKKAILVDPRFAKAYQAMGFAYESLDDRQSAVECFKKALELE
jgi:tetratricopeptide (TPR) repeat protein